MEKEDMKLAQCRYGSFSNYRLNLHLKGGDIFVVTPEIMGSPEFQTGLKTRNFIFIEIKSLSELKKCVNVTDAILQAFTGSVAELPDEPKADEADLADVITDDINDIPDDGEETEGDEPVVAFTELAGNVKKAVKAIRECDDLDELKLALKLDERKTVQSALKIRIKELEG